MIKFNRVLFITANFILTFLTFIIIYSLRYSEVPFFGIENRIISMSTLVNFLSYGIIFITLNISLKIYEINKIIKISESILSLYFSSFFSMGIIGLYFYFTQSNFARFVFFTGFLTTPIIISTINKLLFFMINKKNDSHRIFYAGSKNNYLFLKELFLDNKKWFHADVTAFSPNRKKIKIPKELKNFNFIILDTDQTYNKDFLELLNAYELNRGKIYSLADIFTFFDQSLPVEIITNTFYSVFSYFRLESYYYKYFKRLIDIFLSLILIFLLSPVFLMVMMILRITSKQKIFFRQSRATVNNKEFNIIKFRTMRSLSNDKVTKKLFTEKNDKRLTFTGKILRSLRLDELPQLFNVLKGDMSLIGPRPERPEVIKKILKKYPYFNKRLLIKPGLTGWAQVKYDYVSKIKNMNKKLSYDLYYIKNISFAFDIKILLYTLETIIFRRGAV